MGGLGTGGGEREKRGGGGKVLLRRRLFLHLGAGRVGCGLSVYEEVRQLLLGVVDGDEVNFARRRSSFRCFRRSLSRSTPLAISDLSRT